MSTSDPHDPVTYHDSAIDPEVAAFNAEIEKMSAQGPDLKSLPPPEARRMLSEGGGAFPPVERSDRAIVRGIPGPAGDIGLRCILPDTVNGVFYHVHGGGWVLGTNDLQDEQLVGIADACGLAVVSVEYRLAPENPYPAGPDDCEAAAVWLAENAAGEFGSDRIFIGGESAGAHLALVTMLRMRDRHGFAGYAAANLVFGIYDLAETPSFANFGESDLILDTPTMRWFVEHFAPAEKLRDPDVSPMYADLSGLCPALFTVGTSDPLRDDSLFMHALWVGAGNQAELAVYPGGPHGFTIFPTAQGRAARARIFAFLNSHL